LPKLTIFVYYYKKLEIETDLSLPLIMKIICTIPNEFRKTYDAMRAKDFKTRWSQTIRNLSI